jgi:hypothetical protein
LLIAHDALDDRRVVGNEELRSELAPLVNVGG